MSNEAFVSSEGDDVQHGQNGENDSGEAASAGGFVPEVTGSVIGVAGRRCSEYDISLAS